jgi:ribonuclease HII
MIPTMSPLRTSWKFERTLWAQGFTLVAGTDEVGMGCLAGPVVAAAVILPKEVRIDLIRDSKTLSAIQRERLATLIRKRAVAWAVGEASPAEIATLNLHWAAVEAMQRALAQLQPAPDAVLSDAYRIPNLTCYHEAIIKGDQKVRSVAAASIVAKVYRDALMIELDRQYPGYGLAIHKGYGTAQHQHALQELGPSPIHRLSFEPIRLLLQRASP